MAETLEQKIAEALYEAYEAVPAMGVGAGTVNEQAAVAAKVAREHYHDTQGAHIVVIKRKGDGGWEWNLQHPLACREGGITSLVDCRVNALLVEEGCLEREGTFEVKRVTNEERFSSAPDDGIAEWLEYSPI